MNLSAYRISEYQRDFSGVHHYIGSARASRRECYIKRIPRNFQVSFIYEQNVRLKKKITRTKEIPLLKVPEKGYVY